jgi:hypothetical protein
MTAVVFSVPPRPTSLGNSDRDVFAPVFPEGTSRTPAGGNCESAASERIVIHPVPLFAGNLKLPLNV